MVCSAVQSNSLLADHSSHGYLSTFPCQVLDVLCSLCVCNGVAVRSNQNLITENLLPGRDLLLQTSIINYVTRWVSVYERVVFLLTGGV